MQRKRLSELQLGEQAVIISFSNLDEKHVRRLSSLGAMPGCLATVIQLSPTLVISFEQTQLALDREISSYILTQQVR